MLGKGRHSPNSDEDTSEATSRATTPETTATRTQSNIPISQTVSTSPSQDTVVSRKTDATSVTLKNQQKPSLDTRTNNSSSSSLLSSKNVSQLIPGSIMINDRGEIDNKSSKQSTRFDARASNNSFQPGGQFVSDNNGGPGGFLAPTHIQRRIVTSPGVSSTADNRQAYQRSSSQLDSRNAPRPEFNRQQTFPETTNHDIQPWVNPYWSKTNQPVTDTNGPDKSTSSNGIWKNPYWKDWKPEHQLPAQQQDKPWKNPNWSEKNTTTQSTDNNSLRKSSSTGHSIAKVPSFYKRVHPSESSSTLASSPTPSSQKQSKKKHSRSVISENISDDNELPFSVDNQSVAHYRSTSKISVNTNKSTKQPTTPTPSQKNKPIPSPSSISQNNQPRPQLPDTNNHPQQLLRSLSTTDYASLNTSSANILTEADITSITNALKLLETNSKDIRVIETPDNDPSPNTNNKNNTISNLVTSFPGNQDQGSNQQPTQGQRVSSGFAPPFSGDQNQQQPSSGIGSLFSGNKNQQQQPPPTQASSGLGSLFSGNQNQQQQPSSGIGSLFSGNQNQQQQPSSGIGSLFSGNQNQQQQSSTQFNNNQEQQPTSNPLSSGLGSLFPNSQNQQQPQFPLFNSNSTAQFSGNLGQQQPPPFSASTQVLYFDAKPYSSNNDSQAISTVFSKPSYPFDSNTNSIHLVTKGPIVLI